MGRASSSKKVARAARAASVPGSSKSFVWPVSIGLVVLLGVGLIALSAAERENTANAAPILGDHWHAAQGVYGCDGFLAPANDVVPDESGIHSHGDGLMHIHPFSTLYTGSDANIAAFGETTGIELDDDSISVASGERFANGDDCGGEPGVVQVKVWEVAGGPEGRLLESDFADFAPQDGDVVTIAFAPEGSDIPKPPSADTQPTDVAPPPGEPVPQEAPSTVPLEEDEPTEDDAATTTAPPPSTSDDSDAGVEGGAGSSP